MFRKLLLVACLVMTVACSSQATPPESGRAGRVIPGPAAQPEPFRISMEGELNAMPSLAALGDQVAVVWTGTKDGVMSVTVVWLRRD